MAEKQQKKIVIGVSGASGAIYASRLIEILTKHVQPHAKIYLIVTKIAEEIARHEGVSFPLSEPGICRYAPEQLFAPIASGSFVHDGMVIIPCSMKTLSEVATGHASGLMTRAADVCLKERRSLVLVLRETPLSRVHMTNMLAAHDAGAVILPATPPFYMNPVSIEELIDTIVARVLDILHIEHNLTVRWNGDSKPSKK